MDKIPGTSVKCVWDGACCSGSFEDRLDCQARETMGAWRGCMMQRGFWMRLIRLAGFSLPSIREGDLTSFDADIAAGFRTGARGLD